MINAFKQRLRSVMADRNLSQADVVRMCQPYCRNDVILTKQDMNRFYNGQFMPNREKLEVLSKALSVSELWLCGYEIEEGLTEEELRLVNAWRVATEEEKEIIAFILRKHGFLSTDISDKTSHTP